MELISLMSQWERVKDFENLKGYKVIRISSECIPDLFVGTNEEGLRCLFLYLPDELKFSFKEKEKDKISLSFVPRKNIIEIKLKDSQFDDLFNELILSLHSKIELIKEPKDALHEFIQNFNKWSSFFENKSEIRLSEEIIQGLFGELLLLMEYVSKATPSSVNGVIRAWKGPYGSMQDYVFDFKHVEVKTRLSSQLNVSISSEYQLEMDCEKDLELCVFTVEKNLSEGITLYVLIQRISDLLRVQKGDVALFYHALSQFELSLEGSIKYNNFRYVTLNRMTFNVLDEGFPRIIRCDIQQDIVDVTYSIQVSGLRPFIIEEKEYQYDH